MADTPQPSGTQDPADAMHQLRMQALETSASESGIEPNDEFPDVFGVLMEFPIGDITATVFSLCDGHASLYTTSTFGVIGGAAHESVRVASIAFVKGAAALYEQAIPTTDYPYPAAGHVRFYLLAHSGVRVVDTDLASIESGRSEYTKYYGLGQDVLTQLRLITEQQGSDNTKGEIIEAIFAGRKIDAIKLYREATGASLSQAKAFIEELTDDLREKSPEKFKPLSSGSTAGCGSSALFFLTAIGIVILFATTFIR